jgi:hypothetical protein
MVRHSVKNALLGQLIKGLSQRAIFLFALLLTTFIVNAGYAASGASMHVKALSLRSAADRWRQVKQGMVPAYRLGCGQSVRSFTAAVRKTRSTRPADLPQFFSRMMQRSSGAVPQF